VIEGLEAESGERICPEKTLIVFDEVQEVPKALTSLKYFNENAPEYAVVSAGSLLGVALHQGTSFPVGKVSFMDLYPMSFCEYLEAIEKEQLSNMLQKKDWEMVKVFKSDFIDYLRKYYFVGGMPKAVFTYAETRNYADVREVQTELLAAYEQDFSKHAPYNIVPRIRALWNSIPSQLARENKKFSPGVVEKGSRIKDYELAMQWLLDCGLLHKVEHISKPSLPLSSYGTNFFKLYMLDCGLLGAKSGLDARTLIDGNKVFEEFKGSLTENFALQELVAKGLKPFYWSSEREAEVDFVYQFGSDVLPLEIKAEENKKGKSLAVYSKKYNPKVAYRSSMSDFRDDGWLINIPLYGLGVWEYPSRK
jgi:predicted AAA+ superfamily ATPase